jgi:hypothetical protein
LSKQLLFYEKVAPISIDRHKDLYVKAPENYEFANSSNSLPLMAVEFAAAASDYAIVFAGSGDSITPVTMLGIENEQNLYVDNEGNWGDTYIPAFVRRYPFVFSKREDKFFLCIDEDYEGCNDEGLGERLFDAAGERTKYLGSVLNFVQEYQAQFNRTKAFCAKLQELNLLETMKAEFNLPSGKTAALTGFMAISRARLKELDADKLAELVKTDELELIYMHIQSMRNFSTVVKLAGGETPDEADAEGMNSSGSDADDVSDQEAVKH